MNIHALRKFLLYAMVLIAFLTLQLSGELSPWAVFVFHASMAASWYWEEPRVRLSRWSKAWTAATVAVFGLSVVDVFVFDEFFLIAALRFVLFLTASKLFQRAEQKDYMQGMALSLLLVAAGAVLNDDISFGALFAAYVVAGTLGLTLQHLNTEVHEHHGERARGMAIDRAVLWSTSALAVVVFAGSVGFFFAFPRIGFGFFMAQSRRGVTTSGFGEDVELGSHGTIQNDATIVMRVEFPDGPPAPVETLHWRGLSLDRWDGRNWRDEDDARDAVQSSSDELGYVLGPESLRWRTWEEVTAGLRVARIYLEPIDSDVLFAPGPMRAISFPLTVAGVPMSVFQRNLTLDQTGEIRLSTRSQFGVTYDAWFSAEEPSESALRDARWPDGSVRLDEYLAREAERIAAIGEPSARPEGESYLERIAGIAERDPELRQTARLARHYLQLPDGAITPRMQAMLDGLASEADSPWELAQSLQRVLSETLAYTTDLPEPSGPDANLVDEFLFEWRRGHCEYFATSMVILLRGAGVPARIVNGFLGADPNRFGGYWLVRQAYAHSWVEAWFPGVGWVALDPTPSAAVTSFSARHWYSRAAEIVDSLRLKWFRWVVEYDVEKQFNLVRDALGGARNDSAVAEADSLRSMGFRIARWLRTRFLPLFGVLLLLTACVAFYVRRDRRRIPWGTTDWSVGAAWLIASILLVRHTWHDPDTVLATLVALVPPCATVGIAWALRRGLFVENGEERARAKAWSEASRWYASLLRDVERERGDLPLGVTVGELGDSLAEIQPATREELARFIAFYQSVRFGGRPAETHAAAWRSRFKRLRRAVLRDIREAERQRLRAVAGGA